MKYWSRLARGISPYTPGEQPKQGGLIKLNTNECPYPPSPRVLEAIHAAAAGSLRLYPDPESGRVREAVARRHGVTPEEVFPGNGSDEVLGLCFPAYFDPDAPVRFADITYSFYEVYSALFQIPAQKIPLNEDFTLPPEKFFASPGGVLIANPNAPTSLALEPDAIEQIARNNPGRAVIIDEAYAEFGAQSALPLTRLYDNLLVVKTLSKSHALAGLRVGFALGAPSLLEALRRVKNSFNSYPLDRLAQAGAIAAMEDEPYYQDLRARIIRTRENAVRRLRELGGDCLPSCANFLFVRFPGFSGKALLERLRQRNILVRHFNRPRIEDYLRVTVGADDEMEQLFTALSEILRSPEIRDTRK